MVLCLKAEGVYHLLIFKKYILCNVTEHVITVHMKISISFFLESY